VRSSGRASVRNDTNPSMSILVDGNLLPMCAVSWLKTGGANSASHHPGCSQIKREVKETKETKECAMDWNRIEGNWKQFKGRAKEKWGPAH
jgi:hypothetical protein